MNERIREIADIVKLIQQEHQFWQSRRVEALEFTEKNRLAMGEITCERLLHKIKGLGYEILFNE